MKLRCLMLSLMAFLAGNGVANAGDKPIKLYDGAERPSSEVVTLTNSRAREGGIVLLIDGKNTSSCFVNCMFRKPIHMLPGLHTFSTNNCHFPPTKKTDADTPGIPENAHIVTLKETHLFDSSFSFSFEDDLAKGKTYELRYGHRKGPDGSVAYYVWWQEHVAPELGAS